MSVQHKNITGADAIHPVWYEQSSDPGAVGADKLWLDTTGGATLTAGALLKRRNAGDTGWDTIADVKTALDLKANLASPTFTGTPTAPTPAGADDSTTVATTEWVRDYVTGGGGGGGGVANHAYYTYLAAKLEPLAIEPFQKGAFSYAINSSTTKLLHTAWKTRLGSSGRLEHRDPSRLLPLRGVTVAGIGSDSTAVFIDPSLPTYTDARTTYYDRLNTLATSSLKYLALTAPTAYFPLLPGPYGSMIVWTTTFDLTWLAIAYDGTSASNLNTAFTNEIGDTGSTDYQRVTTTFPFAVSKNMGGAIQTGQERTAGAGSGGIAYVILPSTWGAVTDSTTYSFRDDFLGASLDTATKWTRAQSTAGNVEVNTDYAWLKMKGNSSWGSNGLFSQTGVTRAAGKVFQCDVYTGDGTGAGGTAGAPNVVVGWHDGTGHSYTDFAHGLDFTEQTNVRQLFVFENGTSRGQVGSSYSLNTIYRVRITLGASSATYEIQGGSQYEPIGSASWTNITPGTTSSTTTPIYAGAAIEQPVTTCYVGDVKTS